MSLEASQYLNFSDEIGGDITQTDFFILNNKMPNLEDLYNSQ